MEFPADIAESETPPTSHKAVGPPANWVSWLYPLFSKVALHMLSHENAFAHESDQSVVDFAIGVRCKPFGGHRHRWRVLSHTAGLILLAELNSEG